MLSPPTLQPSDPYVISSWSSTGDQIDTCTVYASNLLPNLFRSVTISLSTMTVNANAGLQIQLVLSDFSNNYDDIQIIFPSEIIPSFYNISGNGIYNTSLSSVNGQILTLYHRRINSLFAKLSNLPNCNLC